MKVNKWFESKNISTSEKKSRYINRENGGLNESMNESEYDVPKSLRTQVWQCLNIRAISNISTTYFGLAHGFFSPPLQ